MKPQKRVTFCMEKLQILVLTLSCWALIEKLTSPILSKGPLPEKQSQDHTNRSSLTTSHKNKYCLFTKPIVSLRVKATHYKTGKQIKVNRFEILRNGFVLILEFLFIKTKCVHKLWCNLLHLVSWKCLLDEGINQYYKVLTSSPKEGLFLLINSSVVNWFQNGKFAWMAI